jgi:hypothetical protein
VALEQLPFRRSRAPVGEHNNYKSAVCKVRGLFLLLRVGTLWRCGDSLFFEVPPLASDVLTTLHPLLENVLQTVDHFEISCLGAPFSWLEKPKNRMGRDLNWILCSAWKNWIGVTPLEYPPYSTHSCSAILKRVLLKRTLKTVRGMKTTPLLRYPHHYNLA